MKMSKKQKKFYAIRIAMKNTGHFESSFGIQFWVNDLITIKSI